MHQVRGLIFDNYQRYPASLRQMLREVEVFHTHKFMRFDRPLKNPDVIFLTFCPDIALWKPLKYNNDTIDEVSKLYQKLISFIQYQY